jgi:DNA-binding NarL/FixJ family response regulator
VTHSRAWHAHPDEAVIVRAIDGERFPSLKPREIRRIVLTLTTRGWSASRIAGHVGCSMRTVQRRRVRERVTR